MLQYFPTPYPDELWYSVMCRYYIRSGSETLLTMKNRSQFPIQLFFPDRSIVEIVKQLPEGLFSVKDIAINHTLFPYFSRMYTRERKQENGKQQSRMACDCQVYAKTEILPGMYQGRSETIWRIVLA